jgi:membrane protein required for colicin V production
MEPHSVFNTFDYIVIGVVLLSALLALMRGFVRELFSLIAWVGAYFVAIKFYAPAVPWAHTYVKNDKFAEMLAMGVVFVITLIVLMVIGYFVCKLIRGQALTVIDRSLGFLYGLARGALVVSLVYLGTAMVLWNDIDIDVLSPQQQTDGNSKPPPQPPAFLLEAKTLPLLIFGAKTVKPLLPKEIFEQELKNVKEMSKKAGESFGQRAIDAVAPSESSDGKRGGPIDVDKLFKRDGNP